jgi:hypothetical protein
MNTMKEITAGVLLCLISLSAGAQTDTERAVLKLSERKFAWLINQQTDSLNMLLDARIQYIHSNGWVQSRQEVFDDMTSGKLEYKLINIRSTMVRLYGHTAIVTGRGRFVGNREGTEFDMELSYTEVYIKEKKNWKLVTRHANRMI